MTLLLNTIMLKSPTEIWTSEMFFKTIPIREQSSTPTIKTQVNLNSMTSEPGAMNNKELDSSIKHWLHKMKGFPRIQYEDLKNDDFQQDKWNYSKGLAWQKHASDEFCSVFKYALLSETWENSNIEFPKTKIKLFWSFWIKRQELARLRI